jgi:hypothetical protein
MVSYLAAEHPVAIDLEALPGTAWTCTSDGCGIHRVGGWRKPSTAPGFHMGMSGMPGFDGSYALEAITASTPAVESR